VVLDLLDCLREVCNKKTAELGQSLFDLHEIKWERTNAQSPSSQEQHEHYQFRINKSKGRVIGFKTHNTFYIVWLDPHHNLTNSAGYGKESYHYKPLSQYEEAVSVISEQQFEIAKLQEEVEVLCQLLEND